MKKLINKWNGKEYSLLEYCGSVVILQRADGTTFEISISELHANYREVEK